MPSQNHTHTVTCTTHAGAMNTAPNTEASILAALECIDTSNLGAAKLGFGIIEVDVRFSPQGKPVLSHDPVRDESAYSLAECFDLARRYAAHINLDLKEAGGNVAEIRRLAELHGLLDRVFFTGLRAGHIPNVRGLGIPYYLNVYPGWVRPRLPGAMRRLVRKAKALGAVGLNLPHQQTTSCLVRAARAEGLLVSAWTVDTPAGMKHMLALGVDNITTRKPDELIRMMKEDF